MGVRLGNNGVVGIGITDGGSVGNAVILEGSEEDLCGGEWGGEGEVVLEEEREERAWGLGGNEVCLIGVGFLGVRSCLGKRDERRNREEFVSCRFSFHRRFAFDSQQLLCAPSPFPSMVLTLG